MNYFSLLTPWLVLVAIFIPLMMSERWVHQHFFGVVYLLTKDKRRATRAFYIAFFPGIFIHEFVQYLVAGALNVPIKKGFNWPEQQENGTLRLNFVVVERDKTDVVRAAIVAAAPLIFMMVIIWQISTRVLALDDLLAVFGNGDITLLWKEFTNLFKTGDFILWFYLLFAIANAMIPKREDAQGWPLILGVLSVIILIMLVIGLDEVLLETWQGPVTNTLEHVNTALFLALMMDGVAIFILGMIEDTLERMRGIKMDYGGGENLTRPRELKREPGSDLPYPKGEPLPSIYNFLLPVPDPADKPPRSKPAVTPELQRPVVTARPSALASRAPLAEVDKSEEKPVEEPPRERFPRPGFGERPSAPPVSGSARQPARPDEKPVEEPPRERFPRPGFGERPSAPPMRQPTKPDEKPVEEPPRERFPRPAFGERPSAPPVRQPARPEEKPAEEPPRERFPRPGFGERPSAPPVRRPTKPEEKPSEESPRERFPRPGFGERPSAPPVSGSARQPARPEEKPAEEPPRERFPRPGFGERPSAPPVSGSARQPAKPDEKPVEEPPRERFPRPGFGERPSAPPVRQPTKPEEKPSEESPRERFPRPAFGERPSAPPVRQPARPEEKPAEQTQKPEQRARPTGISATQENPTVQRRFTPAPRRTQPFVLDEDTADELDTELEYVDFDEEAQPPSEDD